MITNDDTQPVTFAEVISFLKKCWPFYKPQVKHLMAYVSLTMVAGALVLGSLVLSEDLIYNKLLQGQKLQSLQVSMLLLDDTYLNGASANEETLSLDQRNQLRSRIIIAGGIWIVFV